MVTAAAVLGALGASGPMLAAAIVGVSFPSTALVSLGAKVPGLLFDLGEAWRLGTAHFAHADPVHLLVNLFLLGHLGVRLERRLGSGAVAGVLAAGALGCGLSSAAFSGGLGAGASGLVFALLGAALVEGPGAAAAFVGLALAGAGAAGVDQFGHLGGFAGGGGFMLVRHALGATAAGRGLVAAAAVVFGTFTWAGQWSPRAVGPLMLELPRWGVVRRCGEGCATFTGAAGEEGLRVAVFAAGLGVEVPAPGCDGRWCAAHGQAAQLRVVAVWPAFAPAYAPRVAATFEGLRPLERPAPAPPAHFTTLALRSRSAKVPKPLPPACGF